MANPNLGDIIAKAWDQELRTSPDPFDTDAFNGMFGLPYRTYQQRLDRQRRNSYGDLIPRIDTVRRNLRLLNDPHLPASRLP